MKYIIMIIALIVTLIVESGIGLIVFIWTFGGANYEFYQFSKGITDCLPSNSFEGKDYW